MPPPNYRGCRLLWYVWCLFILRNGGRELLDRSDCALALMQPPLRRFVLLGGLILAASALGRAKRYAV